MSPAAGSTTIQVPSGASDSRTCRAAASGSPMSCRQSNVVTRSYPAPVNVCADSASNVIRPFSPASAPRLRASSIDSGW